MFFKSKYGQKVGISNGKQWNLSKGGVIPWNNFSTDERFDDCINALLEDGSVVIPRSVAHLMNDCPYPITGKVQNNRKKLVTTIVEPEELIVNKKYADKVLRWLKTKGVTLPLEPDDNVI
jgi:hypothetical protein